MLERKQPRYIKRCAVFLFVFGQMVSKYETVTRGCLSTAKRKRLSVWIRIFSAPGKLGVMSAVKGLKYPRKNV